MQSTSIGTFADCAGPGLDAVPAGFPLNTRAVAVSDLGNNWDYRRIRVQGGQAGVPFRISVGPSTELPEFQADWVNLIDFPPARFGNSWDGLDATAVAGNTTVFYGGIGGDLTGGIVGVDQLIRFDAGGSIDASIVADSVTGSNGIWIEAGSVGSGGDITTDKLQRLRTTGSSSGDVTVSGDVLLRGIDIGGSYSGAIDVGGDVNASTTGFSGIKIGGDFSGSIEVAGSLGGDANAISIGGDSTAFLLTIDGDVTAPVDVDGNLRRLRVLGSMSADISADSLGFVDPFDFPALNI